MLCHSLVSIVGGGEELNSIKVSLYEDQSILSVEFCQIKRDDLFLKNLLPKRTVQLTSCTVISKCEDQPREHLNYHKQNVSFRGCMQKLI